MALTALGALLAAWSGRLLVWQAAGVALGDIDFCFAWQAWHLVTLSDFRVSCGSSGTHGTGLALVAGLGLTGLALVARREV